MYFVFTYIINNRCNSKKRFYVAHPKNVRWAMNRPYHFKKEPLSADILHAGKIFDLARLNN